MSADLYNSQIDDDVYGAFSIEMYVTGSLRIIVYDPGTCDLVAAFNLPPNEEGFEEAIRIAKTLTGWVERCRELSK